LEVIASIAAIGNEPYLKLPIVCFTIASRSFFWITDPESNMQFEPEISSFKLSYSLVDDCIFCADLDVIAISKIISPYTELTNRTANTATTR
jgi:hypothetical protein